MEPKQPSEKRFALLIDADNVSAKYLPAILDELSKYGTVTYKRIYGDWTSTLHAKWKDTLLENSITPIQQFSYTQGKNATDSAMIIDAMDIMYTHSVQGFCLVSSDSDFTRLAARIREGGLTVIGMGEKKTPTPFRTACDVFTTLELLVGAPTGRNGKGRSKSGDAPAEASTPTLSKKDVEHAVVSIIEDNLNNGKSTGLGEVGSRLLKRYPDFDVRSYGTNQLKKLLDEFASVAITKEGNSVTVDLVEDRPDAPAASAVFEAQSGDGDSPVAEAATDASAQNGGEADEPSESAPKSSRRNARHRRKKVVSIPTDGAETSAQQPADEGGAGQAAASVDEGGAAQVAASADKGSAGQVAASSDAVSDAGSVEPAPIDPTVSTDSIIESVLTVDSTTSPVEEPVERDLKPGRAARIRARRSRKPSAPEEPQVEGAVEVKVAESKTAAASKAAKVKAAAAPADAATPKTPAAPAAAPADAASQPGAPVAADPSIESAGPARDDVRSHIDALLAEAGDAGVSLPALGKRLRSKFHDFRLRDLGYSKLKDFVADLDGIVVEQRGSTSWALLAPSSSGDDARS